MTDDASDLSYEEFVEARESYRQQEAAKNTSGTASSPKQKVAEWESEPDGPSFVLYSAGPRGFFAVFEDAERAGTFYLYNATEKRILQSAEIYDRAQVAVDEDVVDIGWAEDGSVCGLAVWGEFRAFLGISKNLEMRKPVTDTEERGISSENWPAGFERYLEKKID